MAVARWIRGIDQVFLHSSRQIGANLEEEENLPFEGEWIGVLVHEEDVVERDIHHNVLGVREISNAPPSVQFPWWPMTCLPRCWKDPRGEGRLSRGNTHWKPSEYLPINTTKNAFPAPKQWHHDIGGRENAEHWSSTRYEIPSLPLHTSDHSLSETA